MKVLAVISIILVVVGLVIGFIALASSGFDLQNTEKRVSESFTLTEEIRSLEINTTDTSLDVIIKKGTQESVTLDIVRKETQTVDYSVSDGKLSVGTSKIKNWFANLFNFGYGTAITVTLPEKEYERLSVRTSAGDVRISGFTFSGDVSINTSSGDVRLASINADSLCASTTSGEIEITRAKAVNAFSLNATSGDIDVSEIIANKLSVDGTSSDIEIDKATLGSIDKISSTSGEIELSEVLTTGTVIIKTTSGDTKIEGSTFGGKLFFDSASGEFEMQSSDAAELDIDTASGDVTLLLLSPKNFVTDTSSGRVRVNGSLYTAPLCEVHTSSGDIEINIK